MDAGARFAFDPAATFDVTGATSLDNSFGVASLVTASGSAIDWNIIGDGTYTLIGLTPSSFSNITNYGIGNAASLGGGKLGYFDSSGGLQLVIVPEPSVPLLVVGGISLLALQRRRARALERQRGR
jgi:hypothetical protein